MHGNASNCIFKADLRIVCDEIKQRYNVENDVAVTEAEEDAGDDKFTSDRYKIAIENKTIIDRFLMNGDYVTSVDALQVHGLQISFVNTSLEASGLYVSTQFHQHSITNSLKDLQIYMDLALELLCFRDNCVSTRSIYNEHTIQEVDIKRRGKGKRPANHIQDDSITVKQESIRGTWNPPRSTRTPPPAVPDNLWK